MKFSTTAIHAGYHSDPTTRAAAVPVYQTTSYTFDDSQHGADLFNLAVPGNIYTRMMNPTHAVLEARVAALEGGVGALALASGMSAIAYALQVLCSPGSNIVSTSQLYGGTYNLFAHSLPNQGVTCRFVAHDDLAGLEAAIDDDTRALFCESIGNPAGNVVDLAAWAAVAERHGVPLIVDNTVATPYLCRPFEHGAHIVVHSLTKYIGGHGTTLGGAIVDSGKFDWKEHAQRFPLFSNPDPSYHGVVYTEAFGEAAYIARCRVVPLRNTGAALSPFNAFLLLQGLETLALRMERHEANATAIAQFLRSSPYVTRVLYPGHSGMVSFDLAESVDVARFLASVRVFTFAESLGGVESLVTCPSVQTHADVPVEVRASYGLTDRLMRLSVGIEHVDDLIADLAQAFEAAHT